MKNKQIDAIVKLVAERFHTFGGGVVGNPNNPLAHWTKDDPSQFALGVDVREVVEFVVKRVEKAVAESEG